MIIHLSLIALAKDDRMPSFLQTDSEKQGKVSQIPELVQYARDCPVHWTSKITTQNINVGTKTKISNTSQQHMSNLTYAHNLINSMQMMKNAKNL